jgi:arsenite methyltransferase
MYLKGVPCADPDFHDSPVFPAGVDRKRKTGRYRNLPSEPLSGMDFHRLVHRLDLGMHSGTLLWPCSSCPRPCGWAFLLPMRNVCLSWDSLLHCLRPNGLILWVIAARLNTITERAIAQMTESNSQKLREEFNRWAEAGRGEGMERDHLPITLPVLQKMRLVATDNLLDVGCGSGWLARRLATLVPDGRVVGIDVSDEMVRVARRGSASFDNVLFVTGEAEEIPWEANFFSHAISVESSYYWPDPAAGIKEIFRVLRPGGHVWILINYYRDNLHCHQWGDLLEIRTHLLSAEEWAALFRAAGFTRVEQERVVDLSASPENYTGKWFRDANQMKAFKAEGALLISGEKA